MSDPTPTMGRIVHFVKGSGIVRAAVITLVHDGGVVNLTVFESNGDTYGAGRVAYNENGKQGTWHWPPRV